MVNRACLLVALACSSCLYLGTKNSAPEGAIVAEESSALLWKGQDSGINLSAQVDDPDQDELSFRWQVAVQPAEEGSPCFLARTNGPDNCVTTAVGPLSTKPVLQLTHLPWRGRYEVTLEVADIYGASRQLSYAFEVTNEAPSLDGIRFFQLLAGGVVEPVAAAAPVHAHLEAQLADLSDREGDLRCGGPGHASWELLYPAQEALEYWSVLPCQGQEHQDGRLRLRLVAEADPLPDHLELKVTLDDGQGGTVERQAKLPLLPNRPPCLEAQRMMPPAEVVVPVVYDDLQGYAFDAGRVDDDVHEGHRFSWWMRRAGEADFSPVPTAAGPLYLLPAGSGEPGEQLELRVAVQDLYSPFPGCSAEEAFCQQEGLMEGCFQWVTWQVKLR